MNGSEIHDDDNCSCHRRGKRPRYYKSAYKIFFEEKRAELIHLRLEAYDECVEGKSKKTFEMPCHSTISIPQLTNEINQMWRDLSSQDRDKFKDRALIDSMRKRVDGKDVDPTQNSNSEVIKDKTQMVEFTSADDARSSTIHSDLCPVDWMQIKSLLDDDLIDGTLSDHGENDTKNPDLSQQSSDESQSVVEIQVMGSITQHQTIKNPQPTNITTTTARPSVLANMHPKTIHPSTQPSAIPYQLWHGTTPIPYLQPSPIDEYVIMGNNNMGQGIDASFTAPHVFNPMSNHIPSMSSGCIIPSIIHYSNSIGDHTLSTPYHHSYPNVHTNNQMNGSCNINSQHSQINYYQPISYCPPLPYYYSSNPHTQPFYYTSLRNSYNTPLDMSSAEDNDSTKKEDGHK